MPNQNLYRFALNEKQRTELAKRAEDEKIARNLLYTFYDNKRFLPMSSEKKAALEEIFSRGAAAIRSCASAARVRAIANEVRDFVV